MTQKQLIDQFCEFRGKCTTDDVVALNFAYEMLAPRWISVDDELPNNYEPVIAAFDRHFARVCFHCGDTWYSDNPPVAEPMSGITHWMHLSPPPIITSSKKGDEG